MICKFKNAELSFKEVSTSFYEGNYHVLQEDMSFDFCQYTFCVDVKGNLFLVDRDALDDVGDPPISNTFQELFCPVVFSLLDADEKAMLRLGLTTCMNNTAETLVKALKKGDKYYEEYRNHHCHLFELIKKLKK